MKNYSIWLYRLFDVAEEFDLTKVEETLAKSKPTSRLRLARVKSKSIMIENPPVAVDLGLVDTPVKSTQVQGYLTAKVYSLGVISLILRLELPETVSYQEIQELSCCLSTADSIEDIFTEQLFYIKNTLTGTYRTLAREVFTEDYTLFFFRKWHPEWDPVPLLLAEKEELSSQTIEDTLRNSFAYGKKDRTIITWDSALVYDEDGSTDIPDLLEFALTQLLELRYYDDLLSGELNHMYDDIEEANAFSQYSRLNRYRRITRKLMEIVADVTEITEKVQNSLRVTEDVFFARVYSSALSIFRTQAWSTSIQHKISVIQRTYQMLTSEIETSRSVGLEAAIVLLIILEIILGVLKIF